MKVTVRKKSDAVPVTIGTDFIKLEAAMKYASLTATGGEAKALILDGQVSVNEEVCTMRGKKLRDGDVFSFDGKRYVITHASV